MKKILTFLLLGLFMVSFTSAFEFDNIKNQKEMTFDGKSIIGNKLLEKYKPIEIKNAFGLGETLFEGYIDKHDEKCGQDCSSTIKIKTGQDGVLIDDIVFKTLQEDNSWVEQDVRSYQFYIDTKGQEIDINDYEFRCEKVGQLENGTEIEICENILIGSHKEDAPEWTPYSIGEDVAKGTYIIKLEAKKRPSRTIDWIIKSNGVWTDEWAIWGNISEGDDAEVILNSPADASISDTNEVTFNATATVTGEAGLINMSLFTNETGDWELRNTSGFSTFDGVQHLYYFEETSGDILDKFGTNNGSVIGASREENGIIDNSYGFVGTSTEKSIVLDSPVGDTLQSFSFWINPSASTGAIYSTYDGTDYSKITIGNTGGGSCSANKICFSRFDGSWADVQSSASTGTGSWEHWVITIDGTTIKIYKDGALDTSTTIAKASTTPTSSTIGNIAWGVVAGTNFNGYIDEFYVFNRTINLTDIQHLYNSGNANRPSYTSGTQTWNRTITEPIIWNVQACDSDGDCGFAAENFTVFINTIPPEINVESPNGTLNYNKIGGNETLNVTFTDPSLDSCWYDYNGTNITIEGCLNGIKNSTDFILEDNNFNMTIYANDSLSNINSEFIEWNYLILEKSQTYPTTSVESASETYIANVSYDSSEYGVITASLYLNGTMYMGTRSGSGDSAIFTTTATMPSVESSTVFETNWVVGLTNASGTTNINLTSHNVTVGVINLTLCDDTNNISFWNFTTLNEANLVEINSTFEATFAVRSIESTEDNKFIYSNTDGNKSKYSFCISPSTKNYNVDVSIKLTKTDFVDKFYNYQSVLLSNATREDNLYMMLLDDSTSFIVHVVYVDSSDVEGAEVRVQRYYQGTGNWETTEILTTNYVGEAVGHFLAEDADYRFLVYQDGVSILNSSSTKITCSISPCTVTLTIPIVVSTGVETVEDLTSTLTYSPTTNVFTYTYSDTSGDLTQARLETVRVFPSNATLVIPCNLTKTDSSGVLTCDISGQVNGTYRATGYITRDSDEFLTNRIDGVLGNQIYNQMGNDGVLWGIFVLIGIIMLGVNRPSMSIIFGTIGLITLGLLQIINLGAISIIAISAVAAILLMRIGRE